jgi:hypothetical protein
MIERRQYERHIGDIDGLVGLRRDVIEGRFDGCRARHDVS